MLPLLTLSLALQAPPTPSPAVEPEHGKLAWFEGSYEDLLAEAKRSKRLVFIDFWADWCTWCKRLDAESLSDPAVVDEMKDVLCYSVDTETEAGAEIAERFGVEGLPTLVWLEPDGKVRDLIGGYLAPEPFLAEVRRIKRDEGTIGDLERRIAKDERDLDARYELALKRGKLGDVEAREAQIARMRELDPEGRSLPLQRLRMEELFAELDARFRAAEGELESLDLTAATAFVEASPHREIRFVGWARIASVRGFLARQLDDVDEPEKAEAERVRWRAALAEAWKNVTDADVARVGDSVAWTYYQQRDELGPGELDFALSVARKASAAEPANAEVLYTLACCLYAAGRTDEALTTMRRCVELVPDDARKKRALERMEAGTL